MQAMTIVVIVMSAIVVVITVTSRCHGVGDGRRGGDKVKSIRNTLTHFGADSLTLK